MKIPPELFASLPERLGWALLHLLWQGAIVALVLVVLLSLLRRRSAALRHAFCLAAQLAMPVCFVLTLAASAPHRTPAKAVSPVWEPPAVDRGISELEPLPSAAQSAKPVPSAAPAAVSMGDATFHPRPAWKFRAEEWLPWISGLWAAGVCLLSLRRLGGWRLVRRMRKAAAPARAELQQMFAHLRSRFGLRRVVRLLESVQATTPMFIGFLTPAVVLPVQAITGLGAAELEAILAHELAHLLRRDAWSNLALLAVETAFFYHPAVWWISRRARDEREIAADDLALSVCQDRRVYAGALCRLAELREFPSLTLAASGGDLLGRIRRIVQPMPPETATSSWGAPFVVGAFLACVICAGRVHAQQEAKLIVVQPGQSLQAAIDAAPAGATIHLEPGEWKERIVIGKPLTLEGAGWDKSHIRPDRTSTDKEEQTAITIHDASGVVIRKLQVNDGVAQQYAGMDSLVALHRAQATFEGCAMVGPAQNGLRIADGSNATVDCTLVTTLSNYGIVVVEGSGVASSGASRLHLLDSDVRNVDVAGVVVDPGSDRTVIERCRISGGNVGIYYDTTSPTITGNAIFNNRVGITAIGTTRATVKENLFWKDTSDIACHSGNGDAIESNTFIEATEGVRVTSGATPDLAHNLFYKCKSAVPCVSVKNRDGKVVDPGAPTLDGNRSWQCRRSVPYEPKPTSAEPGFRDAATFDFALRPDAPALAAKVGVAEPLRPTNNLWPALKEEAEFQAHLDDESTPRNIEFEGDELITALRTLARQAKVSLGIDDRLNENTEVQVRLENVSPLQALLAIAESNHLWVEAVNGVILVRPGNGQKQPPLPPRFPLESRQPDAETPGNGINFDTGVPDFHRNTEFHNDEVCLVLRTMARQAGVNLIIDDHIIGTVSIRMDHATALEVIQATLALARIEAEVQDGILFLKPRRAEGPPPPVTIADLSAAIRDSPPAAGETDFDFEGDEPKLVFEMLARQAKKSLTIDGPLPGTITVRFKSITPLHALEAIAKDKGFVVTEDHDRITIRPMPIPPDPAAAK